MIPADVSLINNQASLRQRYTQPLSRAIGKVLDHLDVHCRAILALSPFCVLSSQGDGGADISPRRNRQASLKFWTISIYYYPIGLVTID